MIYFASSQIQIYRFKQVGSSSKWTISATFTPYDADIQPATPERTQMASGQIGSVFTAYVDVDVDIKDIYGQTALMVASENGCDSVVDRLLKHGVNADIQNRSGMTALILASSYGHDSVVERINAHKKRLKELVWEGLKDAMYDDAIGCVL